MMSEEMIREKIEELEEKRFELLKLARKKIESGTTMCVAMRAIQDDLDDIEEEIKYYEGLLN